MQSLVALARTVSKCIKNIHTYIQTFFIYIDNEEQQKLIKNIDIAQGKRASDAEDKQLKEKEIELLNEQKNLQQEFLNATKMLEEGSTKLATALNNKALDDVATAEVLVTAANAKLAFLKT
jgi:hypothetical protein